MKATGFLLMQLAALLYAVQCIAEARGQQRTLCAFCSFLEQLHGALESEAPPLPELLQALCGRFEGEVGSFLSHLCDSMDQLGKDSFQTLWQRALEKNDKSLPLEAKRELEELGSVLGRFEISTQLEAIAGCLHRLRQRAASAEREQRQQDKLTLGTSLAISLLLGIILL